MDHFITFFPAICAGFGLFLAGVANLLLLNRSAAVRASATLVAMGIAVAFAGLLNQPGAMIGTARWLAYGIVPFFLLASQSLMTRLIALFAAVNRPVVGSTLLTIAGIGTVIGSVIVCEKADEAATDSFLTELELLVAATDSVPVSGINAATDRGTKVVLKEPSASHELSELNLAEEKVLHNIQLDEYVMRRSSANERTNCHGWVFTGGQFLVGGASVELILNENGYQPLTEPKPGDLIVYKNGTVVSHTGVVRYTTPGQPILIESKWGGLGVFLHEPEKSPYGIDFTYYRSKRVGHLLVGLAGTDKGQESIPATATVEE